MNISDVISCFSLTVEQYMKLTDQQFMILEYICLFGSITPMEAFSELGVTKLATRISEMISIGYKFTKTVEHKKNRHGKPVHYMRYGLDV